MRDAAARDLRDVNEAVHPAEVDERAELGERADPTGHDGAELDLLARLRGFRVVVFPEERRARDDDAPAVLGVLDDPEIERLPDERREGGLVVARDVDLRDRAERAQAVRPADEDVEPALVASGRPCPRRGSSPRTRPAARLSCGGRSRAAA